MGVLFLKILKNKPGFEARIDGNAKFNADTFTYESDDYYLMMNGVNLSFSSAIMEENINFCLKQYKSKGEQFFSTFKGSFCGALHDKRIDKWIVFTNQIGDQKLFYNQNSESILISSDLFLIVSELKNSKIPYSLHINAAYSLLSYGYMTDNSTLIEEISRLTAGEYFTFEKEIFNLKKYFSIDNTPNHKLSEQDYIEQLDILFKKAIQLEFDKDLQYGYKHIASMSGGLDCRMTNFVAHHMGYKDVTNITFSQYGYLDMTIAHQMSSYLGYEWLFKALDNGNFLKDIDQMIRRTHAIIHYSGSAHANSMMNLINFSNFGLLHSGQLGDVTIGTYCPNNAYAKPHQIKATSYNLIQKNTSDISNYKNQELATYNIRGFNGILSGNWVTQEFTEVISPFLDKDFMSFCLSIPAEQRAYHRLYKKWILKKYPEAANFIWESTKAKISDKTVLLRGKIIPYKQLPKFVADGIKNYFGYHSKKSLKHSMNPFEFWYNTNNTLKNYFQTYFDTHIDMLKNDELKQDCIALFSNGTTIEKTQVLTLLSAIKQLEL